MNISAHSTKSTILKSHKLILVSLCTLCSILGGCKNKTQTENVDIAVANSYLNAVVKDLCGPQEPVFDLVPPGMCPGHFDISPSQVNCLCNCKILFVFDFQQNIENALPRIKERGLKVCKITVPAGLCIPDSYLSILRQVADALSEQYPQQQANYQKRLKEIQTRLENLDTEIPARVNEAQLKNCNVLVSTHQADFVKWLGLNPIATFAGRDAATPAQINKNLNETKNTPVNVIIANQQEGTEMAQALADHLNTKLVVFSNFPVCDPQNTAPAYDQLVQENLNRLMKAMK